MLKNKPGYDLPDPIKVPMVWLVDNLPAGVKAKDVIPDGRCPPGLSLVFVPKELLPCVASAIVELPVCQDSK